MGEFFYCGIFVEKDDKAAVEFLVQSSENGSDEAQCMLGEIYSGAIESAIKVDIDLAEKYFSLIPDSSFLFPQATFNLGQIYEGKKEIAKAVQFYMCAAATDKQWRTDARNKLPEIFKCAINSEDDLNQ
jgi:TPR repeat protein